MRNFTKRNHYNPCFWTAYWNPSYFDSIMAGKPVEGKVRDQKVFTLNIHADKVCLTKVDNVHFQKDLGVAEITPESMKRYYERFYPEQLDEFCKYLESHPDSVCIDFEDILTGLEKIGGYDSIIDSIINAGLTSVEHKGFLSIVLIYQAMRSFEMMTFMVESASKKGIDKWEYFVNLKNAWANPQLLARAVTPLAQGKWTFYRTKTHKFPICDSPILINQNSVMAILSPKLLLEIDLTIQKAEDYWEIKEGIHFSKYREFCRRTINNTFHDILFHDADLLEQWRRLPDYKIRHRVVNNREDMKADIAESARRVVFALLGFGRIPDGVVFPV
jgi:hypothetical protein